MFPKIPSKLRMMNGSSMSYPTSVFSILFLKKSNQEILCIVVSCDIMIIFSTSKYILKSFANWSVKETDDIELNNPVDQMTS